MGNPIPYPFQNRQFAYFETGTISIHPQKVRSLDIRIRLISD